MTNNAIISLALLKVLYDKYRKDHLEIFVPFTAQCISKLESDIISTEPIHSLLLSDFGLDIPQFVIKRIISRLAKRNDIDFDGRIYKRKEIDFSQYNYDDLHTRISHAHSEFISEFTIYSQDILNEPIDSDEAEKILQEYLNENQLNIIRTFTERTTLPPIDITISGGRFKIYSFIKHLEETKSNVFEYLDVLAKGNMLASAIYFIDPGSVQKKFKNTRIYFDTTFLIYALGYQGDARKNPCVELLELAYAEGAELRCFTHTKQEIERALYNCIDNYRKVESYSEQSQTGRTIQHFASIGYEESDLHLLIARLDVDLEELRIKIEDKPHYKPEYNIDEKGLQKHLESAIHYYSEKAPIHDVDSIAAIARIRKGHNSSSIEDCRAIFVTTNYSLALLCRDFFRGVIDSHQFHYCTTDEIITTVIWLKKPLAAQGLPHKKIIADCYAALQPNEVFWSHFLREVERSENQGHISSEEVLLLRAQSSTKDILMELTHGEDGAITSGTPREVIDEYNRRILEDSQKEFEKEKAGRLQEREEKKRYKVKISKTISVVRRISYNTSKILIIALKVIILVISLIATSIFAPIGSHELKSFYDYLMFVIFMLLSVASLINIFYGYSFVKIFKSMEIRIDRWLRAKILSFLKIHENI